MPDATKEIMDALRVPPPSAGFEQRLQRVLVAKQQPSATVVPLRPRLHTRPFMRPLAAMAACMTALWLMPSPAQEAHINGLPMLVDVRFDEEGNEEYLTEESLENIF